MPRASSSDKILDCAASLFAKHGYAGTIMDELASKAGVNKATIYYHFKDKEHLYEEVLVGSLKAMMAKVIAAVEAEKTAIQKLKAYILTFAHEKYERKMLTSIMMREVAGGGTQMPDLAKAQMQGILLQLKSILDQGVQEGAFIATDILTLHMMVIGSISFYVSSEPMRKMMVSSDASLNNAFKNSDIDAMALRIFDMVKRAVTKTKEEIL